MQRICVLRPCLEGFLERFVARVEQLVVGDPADEKTDVGPVIDSGNRSRIASWVDEAVAALAKLDRERVLSYQKTIADLKLARATLVERQRKLAQTRTAVEKAQAAAARVRRVTTRMRTLCWACRRRWARIFSI